MLNNLFVRTLLPYYDENIHIFFIYIVSFTSYCV